MLESGGEVGQSSPGTKDSWRQDTGQAAARRNDGSPRKDRKDVANRGGKDHGRPNSASAKGSAATNKKGKTRTSVVSAVI